MAMQLGKLRGHQCFGLVTTFIACNELFGFIPFPPTQRSYESLMPEAAFHNVHSGFLIMIKIALSGRLNIFPRGSNNRTSKLEGFVRKC